MSSREDRCNVVLMLPYQLGPYRLERLLGRGGMGIVYLAYDQRLERRVAIKRMLADSDDPRRRERLRREARTAAQLSHPNIVQVFDLVEGDDGDWIVMELIEGTPLARLLDGGPLDVDLTLKYARQIAEGLAAAHHFGIVHRDLKTENVMVLSDHRVKILDFGLAKRFDFLAGEAGDRTLSEPGEVMGTGRAMSPEQARGLEIGPRSDLFSFGVLIYETLTGASPFRADSFSGTLQRVVTHQPKQVDELADNVPRALTDLVDRLLRKAPELRPASAREVTEELVHLIDKRHFRAHEWPRQAIDNEQTVKATAIALAPDSGTASGIDSGTSHVGRIGLGRIHVQRFYVMGFIFLAVFALAVVALVMFGKPPPSDTPNEGLAVTLQGAETLPDDPLRLYEEGMQAVRRVEQPNNADRAVEIFRRLIQRDGNSAAAHAGLARAYWAKGCNKSGGETPAFLEQAMAMAGEAVRLDSYLADARVSLGLVHHSQGRHAEARGELGLALELDPSNADAYFGLAKVAEALGQPREAEDHYRQAIRLMPTPLYHDALGSLTFKNGRYDEAEEAFSASLALTPDNGYALRNLSLVYNAQGRLDEAAAKLQSAIKIGPTASLYSSLGTIFFNRGLYSKAAAAFEDALNMDEAPNRYINWINLADTYRQLPDKDETAKKTYQRAIQMLDEAIAATPGDARLLSRRALARARADDQAAAARDIARLRALGTSHDLDSLFRLAVTEELCDERERALANLEKALRSGFSLSKIRHEPDLLELRADPRFHHLLVALDGA